MGDGYTNGYTSYTETLFTRYAVVRRVRSQVRTHYARASQSTRESVQRLRPQATQNRHPAGLGEWLKLHLKPTFRPFRGADSETCAAMRSTSSRTASMILAWRNARPSAATPASIVSAVCLTVFRLFASLGKSGRRRESWIH